MHVEGIPHTRCRQQRVNMNELLKQMLHRNIGVTPYDPVRHKSQDIGYGAPSTERLASEYLPDGTIANVPTVWWDNNGNPIEMTHDQAVEYAILHEQMSGKHLPRYDNIPIAVERAKHRSANDGATHTPLYTDTVSK